ncbi:DUF6187 family protein [Actinophytocola algeriensis]|uniref:Uncharacterized protein n=1 Tax=Actinophytocola algeriensis TaxID=1768010 RepID=A0A7W7Q9U5_9PSEU|nr:DUF6187 family protein [Actinophytocola algeriensis]MBB4909334.1 hypothetical protein [Actinophytocola algeriensis]MBE1475324.1 hypothetical protein [Actinophytocola algeriensis]
MSEYDTVFSLPSVDEDPDTELGVLLMGLGPERLLAALGVAGPARDPATALLVVDQLRHDARPDLTFEAALAAGAGRWRAVRPRLAAAAPANEVRSAALRKLWAAATHTVTEAGVAIDRAGLVYLSACWLRRDEIDDTARRH